MSRGQHVVAMTSGGMDSTVMVYWAISEGYQVHPVFLDYGQHCAKTEFETLQSVLPREVLPFLECVCVADVFRRSPSRLIQQTDLWKDEISSADLMLPYRNLFLLVTAAAYAANRGISVVLSAFINSNHAYEIDASREFLMGVQGVLGKIGSVNIQMPFRDLSKLDVARRGLALSAPIGKTYSCQVGAHEHCGSCPNCVERLAALSALSVGP